MSSVEAACTAECKEAVRVAGTARRRKYGKGYEWRAGGGSGAGMKVRIAAVKEARA